MISGMVFIAGAVGGGNHPEVAKHSAGCPDRPEEAQRLFEHHAPVLMWTRHLVKREVDEHHREDGAWR